jgi:hypothetical protein
VPPLLIAGRVLGLQAVTIMGCACKRRTGEASPLSQPTLAKMKRHNLVVTPNVVPGLPPEVLTLCKQSGVEQVSSAFAV